MIKKAGISTNILNGILYNFSSFFYLSLQWAACIFIAQIDGFDTVGLFSLAVSITNTFYVFACYGIRVFQVSDVSNEYDDKAYIINRLFTIVVALFACVLFSSLMNYSFDTYWTIILFCVYKMAEAFSDVIYGVLQKKQLLSKISASLIFKGFINYVFFFLVYYITKKLIIAILALAISSLISVIFVDFQLLRKVSVSKINNKKDLFLQNKKLIGIGALTTFSIATSALINMIPRVALEKSYGLSDLGYFSSLSAPTSIISLFFSFCFVLETSFIADKIIQHNKKSLYKYLYLSLVSIVLVSFVFVCFFYNKIGKTIMSLLFGDAILEHYTLLIPLTFIAALSSVVYYFSVYLNCMRKLKQLFIISFISLIINSVLTAALLILGKMSVTNCAFIINVTLIIQAIIEFVYALFLIKRI